MYLIEETAVQALAQRLSYSLVPVPQTTMKSVHPDLKVNFAIHLKDFEKRLHLKRENRYFQHLF